MKSIINKNLRDYRPVPFWSWNDRLRPEELRRQIRHMKEIGMGGFFMHARGGLQTEYMGEEWFEAISASIDEAEKQDMNAWCYDENGWPSGFAGMKLLEDAANHAHFLVCEKKSLFDKSALAVYKIENGDIIRIKQYTNESGEFICVYDRTNSSVVDILNPEIVRKFIAETHEEYYSRFKEYFGNVMLGFFTDEPQYFRWDTAYSPILLKEFSREYGEDILDSLGALFVDCNQSGGFRFRYWRLMNKLFTENFAGQVFDWCERHGCKLTGHAIEEANLYGQMWCCAGVMPFYEYEHIPGIDWLGKNIGNDIPTKQVASAAQQLGKKQVLTETFACTGWDVTPAELARIAHWQYVSGVNLMCHHLYPYSIRGQRKRDYPAFFSEHNPWIRHLRKFNDYFTVLGFLLTNSFEIADVAVIHPMHSAYLLYDRQTDDESVRSLEKSFCKLTAALGSANVGYHFADEMLLEKYGKVQNGTLIMGKCVYDRIVIPDMPCLDRSTAEMLREYVKNGGKLYLAGQTPHLIDGEPADLDFLKSNIEFTQLKSQKYQIDNTETEIRATYRTCEYGDFLFAVNLSESESYCVKYTVEAKGAKLFDIESNEEKPLYFIKEGDKVHIPLEFPAGKSYIIVFDAAAESAEKQPEEREFISLDKRMKIAKVTENALTLDCARISYDNVNFEEEMPVMAITERLIKERQNRVIYLKYTFNISEIPDSLYIEHEKMNARAVWVNGASLSCGEPGSIDRSFSRQDISEFITLGDNEIVFMLDYFQSEHVYYVLLDCKDGTESLKNCLSYDTDIEAVYILGNFAVKPIGGFTDAPGDIKIAENGFTITKSAGEADVYNIVEQGFPFFAGEITFEQTVNIQCENPVLKLPGRYAAAEIRLNGKLIKTMLFDDICELGEFARPGENKLSITLINGKRNLLGPFHCASTPEPLGVSPETFERRGTWKNGKSPKYRESYAFVRFGIN